MSGPKNKFVTDYPVEYVHCKPLQATASLSQYTAQTVCIFLGTHCIHVGIHGHERKRIYKLQDSALFYPALPNPNNLLGIIDIGAHKPLWLQAPFARFFYIPCILVLPFLFSTQVHLNMNCISLGNKDYFIVIVIVTNGLASQRDSNAKRINYAIPGLEIYLCFINIMETK